MALYKSLYQIKILDNMTLTLKTYIHLNSLITNMVEARVNKPILNSHYFANYKPKILLQIIFNEYKIHQISNVIRFTMQ